MSYVIKKGDQYYTIKGGVWDANAYAAQEYDYEKWAEWAIDDLASHGEDMDGAEVVETPAFVKPPEYPARTFDSGLIQ